MRGLDPRESHASVALAAIVAERGLEPLYVTLDECDEAGRHLFESVGFVASRRESTYRVPTDPAATGLRDVVVPGGIDLVTADLADIDRLRRLDDELRQDVPGADGWRWTDEAFREETFSAEFDPETYLVAVETAGGDYVGIGRVWRRSACPRLGFIGVRPSHRRRGLARALLARAFAVLDGRGVPEVSTEVDDTNAASRALIEGLGARRIGGLVELVRRPD